MMLEYNGIVHGYLLAASLITFVLFGADKWPAVRRAFIPRRLRELCHSGQYAPAVTGCCRKPV